MATTIELNKAAAVAALRNLADRIETNAAALVRIRTSTEPVYAHYVRMGDVSPMVGPFKVELELEFVTGEAYAHP